MRFAHYGAVCACLVILALVAGGCSDTPSATMPVLPPQAQATTAPVLSPTTAVAMPTATMPAPNTTAMPVPTATRVPQPTAAATVDMSVPPHITSVMPNAAQVGQYTLLELTIDMRAAFTNPFDPAQVDLSATFTGPDSHSTTIPGFFWQDYQSSLDSGQESVTPVGQPAWKVRFTPQQQGQWTYTVQVKTPGGVSQSKTAAFAVVASNQPGFLKISPRDPAYMAFSNGSPYFAIGQNVGWYGNGGTQDYAHWFGQMTSNGANFARVWMADWSVGLEWNDTGLGNYTGRMDRAWQLDQIFNLAAQDNIYLMLSLLNHGAFNTTTDAEWDKNPYNAALGGPCAQPEDFATNATARDLFKRRLRYIAARWGYSTHLMAWEWWNEVDWTKLANADLLTPWVHDMSAALSQWDPYHHLRTISYANSEDLSIYRTADIDLVQRHIYSPRDPAFTFPRIMADMRSVGKPALIAEFGGSGQDANTEDKQGVHFRNGQWSALMTKAAGTTMNWWWDNMVDPLNLYPMFAGPAAFVKQEDLTSGTYTPVEVDTGSDQITALALKADTHILGWVTNNRYTYLGVKKQYDDALHAAKGDVSKVATFKPAFAGTNSTTMTFKAVAPGSYSVEWWDTKGQAAIRKETIQASNGTLTVPVPALEQDIAFKIMKLK